jgi:inhibitor of cysteine peptidase
MCRRAALLRLDAAVLMVGLALLVAACQPAQAPPTPAQPTRPQPTQTGPAQVQPSPAASAQAEARAACPDLDDSTAPIATRVGERFVVGLQSNPTTGFRWQADTPSLGGIVQVVDTTYYPVPPSQPGAPPLAGAGGKECLTFEATASGTTTLMLTYRRPFEPATVAPAKTKQLTVNVAVR